MFPCLCLFCFNWCLSGYGAFGFVMICGFAFACGGSSVMAVRFFCVLLFSYSFGNLYCYAGVTCCF